MFILIRLLPALNQIPLTKNIHFHAKDIRIHSKKKIVSPRADILPITRCLLLFADGFSFGIETAKPRIIATLRTAIICALLVVLVKNEQICLKR